MPDARADFHPKGPNLPRRDPEDIDLGAIKGDLELGSNRLSAPDAEGVGPTIPLRESPVVLGSSSRGSSFSDWSAYSLSGSPPGASSPRCRGSRQLPHVALVLSGTLRVVVDDGSQQDFSQNDVMLLPPGHDAWSVGSEPCVFVEILTGQ